ncbi:hypothetical protein Tco_1016107 [Tanacetum coccineum]|uniref:Uncharacterized protein n=1 Tax=Tanacetum coccineum TaxID=301880 RepID=A0ABQ5FQ43_9ASTR
MLASCIDSYKGDLYKLFLVLVIDAPAIPVIVELLDRLYWLTTIVITLAQHGEAIQGIQEHFLGVPIQEELTALRFRVDVAEAENASLRATIKTMEVIEMVTRNHERLSRMEIER